MCGSLLKVSTLKRSTTRLQNIAVGRTAWHKGARAKIVFHSPGVWQRARGTIWAQLCGRDGWKNKERSEVKLKSKHEPQKKMGTNERRNIMLWGGGCRRKKKERIRGVEGRWVRWEAGGVKGWGGPIRISARLPPAPTPSQRFSCRDDLEQREAEREAGD